jgi:hypothetical protein
MSSAIAAFVPDSAPILRDASLRNAPQDDVCMW